MFKEIQPKIENTIFEACRNEAEETLWYRISPAEGYKLHEVTLDEILMDDAGNETGKIKLGFTKSYVTAGAFYDFEKNERQIYAKPDDGKEEIVDADSVDSEIEEKAKAYDILMGADE